MQNRHIFKENKYFTSRRPTQHMHAQICWEVSLLILQPGGAPSCRETKAKDMSTLLQTEFPKNIWQISENLKAFCTRKKMEGMSRQRVSRKFYSPISHASWECIKNREAAAGNRKMYSCSKYSLRKTLSYFFIKAHTYSSLTSNYLTMGNLIKY